jgi:glycosyltransferase involved in cell wall biosynthesis
MRIAINAWFWDSPTTGSGQYTRRLVEHLSTAEPDLELVLVRSHGWGSQVSRFTPKVSDRLQPETRTLKPETSDLKKVWFEQVTFPRACRRLKADVAHVPYWAPPLAPSVPTLVTIHDLIPLLLSEYRGGPLVRLYTALVSRTARSARVVITDSEASRRDIIVNLRIPAERVRVVYLAADERFTPNPAAEDVNVRTRYGLPARYVLYLGGFDVRKNVTTVLAACRRAAPAIGEDCPLVIAGRLPTEDTPFTPNPRRLAQEHGMDERSVHFTGFVDDADKPALYRGAVAFLFPSRYEGFGLPPLEALACGTPVVGSNASSIPEVVGNAGVLRPPDDAEGIADALARFATNADFRAELSHRALAQAARFSWEHTAQETLAAYRDASA